MSAHMQGHPGLAVAGFLLLVACGGPSSGSAGNGAANGKSGTLEGIPWDSPVLAPITGGLSGIEISGRCTLDKLNGKVRTEVSSVMGNEALTVRGWVADGFNAPPKQAMFALQSPEEALAVKLETNVERPDVAKALGAEALSRSGFELTIPPPLPVGTFRVGVLFGGPADPRACSFDYDLVIQ